MKKILFFGGKGGVGKTSCSSSYALSRAAEGHRVLIVSTDPAHSISDVFEKPIGSSPTELYPNLMAIEIDPQTESESYINGIRKNLKTIYSPIILAEINKQLDAASISPGSHESALFDKMMDIINNSSENYDYIIFDTAPTGHTIRLLSLPELMGGWIETLISKRRKTIKLKTMLDPKRKIEDPVIEILQRRKENLEKARSILLSDDKMGFVFVINPEKLPIDETKKAVSLLSKYSIPIDSIIVNKIMPEKNIDPFWAHKKEKEAVYLSQIDTEFRGIRIHKIPLLENDMDNKNLEVLSKHF